MSKKLHSSVSETDWAWITSPQSDNLPIPYDAEEELYDPNNEIEVEAFFKTSKISMPNVNMITEVKKSA